MSTVRHFEDGSSLGPNLLRQFFGLVAGIRPSLFALSGLGSVGSDHLNRDGRVAWRVSMTRLGDETRIALARHGHGEAHDSLLKVLVDWIDDELNHEARRWRRGEMTLRHLVFVMNTIETPSADMYRSLPTVWSNTLSDLVLDVRSGGSTLGRDGARLAAESQTKLACFDDPAGIINDCLVELARRSDPTVPSPDTFPLVAPCMSADLRDLLGASLVSGPG